MADKETPVIEATPVVPYEIEPDKKYTEAQKGMLMELDKRQTNFDFSLTDFNSNLALFERLSKSGIVPSAVNTPEKLFMVIQFGQELGLTPMKSLGLIDVINGTPAPRAAWVLAKAIMCGITYKMIHNAAYVYYDKDGNEVYSETKRKKYNEEKKSFVDVKFRDIVTKMEFSRVVNGNTMTQIAEFRFSEAEAAGLTDKDNWKYYHSDMLFWRTCVRGIRRLAPDLLWFYTVEELTGATEFTN